MVYMGEQVKKWVQKLENKNKTASGKLAVTKKETFRGRQLIGSEKGKKKEKGPLKVRSFSFGSYEHVAGGSQKLAKKTVRQKVNI